MVERCSDIAKVAGSIPAGTTSLLKENLVLDLDFYYGYLTHKEPFDYDKHNENYEKGRQYAILTQGIEGVFDEIKVALTSKGYEVLLDLKDRGIL